MHDIIKQMSNEQFSSTEECKDLSRIWSQEFTTFLFEMLAILYHHCQFPRKNAVEYHLGLFLRNENLPNEPKYFLESIVHTAQIAEFA